MLNLPHGSLLRGVPDYLTIITQQLNVFEDYVVNHVNFGTSYDVERKSSLYILMVTLR